MWTRSLTFEACALENTTERAEWHVEARLACDSDCAGFFRMSELAMAATSAHMHPAVSFHEPNDILDLQSWP